MVKKRFIRSYCGTAQYYYKNIKNAIDCAIKIYALLFMDKKRASRYFRRPFFTIWDWIRNLLRFRRQQAL